MSKRKPSENASHKKNGRYLSTGPGAKLEAEEERVSTDPHEKKIKVKYTVKSRNVLSAYQFREEKPGLWIAGLAQHGDDFLQKETDADRGRKTLEAAHKGGKAPKHNEVIYEAACRLAEKYPNASIRGLWEHVPDDYGPLEILIDGYKYEVYRTTTANRKTGKKQEVIVATKDHDGTTSERSKYTFYRYAEEALNKMHENKQIE